MTPGRTQRSGRVHLGILVGGLGMVALLVAILGSGFGNDPHALPSALDGRRAPTFALVSLDGEPVDLADLAGTPVVLNFWSTWCGPCKYEHPVLQQAAREHPEVRFLGVLYSDKEELARRYLKGAGAAYPTLVDPEGRTAIDYGVGGVPETFFIDRQGVIRHKVAAPLGWDELAHRLSEIVAP